MVWNIWAFRLVDSASFPREDLGSLVHKHGGSAVALAVATRLLASLARGFGFITLYPPFYARLASCAATVVSSSSYTEHVRPIPFGLYGLGRICKLLH